jgi:uncharacterized protein (DUF1015 family)
MPKIKPFKGIRPIPDYAGQVVLDIENLSLAKAKIIRRENPYSFVNMLVPQLDNLFLRGSKNELAFKKINENLDEFLDKGIFIRDGKPSIYVYQTSAEGKCQTGIWTTTHVDDYLNDRLKKHELTRPERESTLTEYLLQTGIDANPVLITYQSNLEITEILKKVCAARPFLSFDKDKQLHKLWKVDEHKDVSALVHAFAKIPVAYIADGHHRAAAAADLALHQRKLARQYNDLDEFNYFTSVYMDFDQLNIYPFHRLVKGLNGYRVDGFLAGLTADFMVEPSDTMVMPAEAGEFGMYLSGSWYKLKSKVKERREKGHASTLDVTVLQDDILSGMLDIHDPRTDPNLQFIGGAIKDDDLMDYVVQNNYSILFTLFPTSVKQLTAVADGGEVMPPKSTWFEPKFPVGLLIHQI